MYRFSTALAQSFAEAVEAQGAGCLNGCPDELAAVEFYRLDLDEYRRECAADEATAIVAGCPEVLTDRAD